MEKNMKESWLRRWRKNYQHCIQQIQNIVQKCQSIWILRQSCYSLLCSDKHVSKCCAVITKNCAAALWICCDFTLVDFPNLTQFQFWNSCSVPVIQTLQASKATLHYRNLNKFILSGFNEQLLFKFVHALFLWFYSIMYEHKRL